MLAVGTPAPDFSLPDQNGVVHTLKEYRGRTLVLYFYPKDSTPGCTKQACGFSQLSPEFQNRDAVVVGVSKDSVASHKKFEAKNELAFTLLSDTELETIKAYDVWQEKKRYGKTSMGVVRTTYVIDPQGMIINAKGDVRAAENPGETLELLSGVAGDAPQKSRSSKGNAATTKRTSRKNPGKAGASLEELAKTIDLLLDSEKGCPWFSRQTHSTLKPECVEEAAEVVCAVNVLEATGTAENLCEELGDLLLQVVVHAQLAQKEGFFTLADVIGAADGKMKRRHPDVFGDRKYASFEEHIEDYREMKRREKAGKEWIEKDYLPAAFEESQRLIDAAIARKKRDA